MDEEAVIDWLRESHRHSSWMTSVCIGVLIVGAAGLLRALRARTHWTLSLDRLAELGAEPASERVVEQGKIITGGRGSPRASTWRCCSPSASRGRRGGAPGPPTASSPSCFRYSA